MMLKAQVSALRLFPLFCIALALPAADVSFAPYAAIRPILQAQPNGLPAALRNADEAHWLAWARQEDKAIRARLAQGDLDTLVNFLLYGVSFTKQPRILMEHLTEASKAGVLRARVDDLASGLRNPGDNERLLFLQQLLRSQGIDPVAGDSEQTGRFLFDHLLRVLKERTSLAQHADAQGPASPSDPASLLDLSALFQDRGLSLDTSIVPAFYIEQTLRDLKARGRLREGQVTRVAVIGPGLDFIDKNEDSAFDYYPPQTLQPFALYDSLVRLGLAKAGSLSLSVFDISPRVIGHLRRARERAAKNTAYVLQLPRNIAASWPPDLLAYWRSLGDRVGATIAPIPPPAIFHDLETRAVRIRPEVVLACQPLDLNIVLERLAPSAANTFDLIVGTNIFVYYDTFRQTLALANAGAMLKHGGFLLTNDRLPVSDASSMHLAGVTIIPFDAPGLSVRQPVGWYQK